METQILPRDYAGLCLKNADSMHAQMKARGLYNGKVVKLPYGKKDIEILIPTAYPLKILAAIAQLGTEAEKDDIDKSIPALDKMAQLLLAVNGVEYPPDLLIDQTDLANLMGTEGGDTAKKAKKPPKKTSST